VTADLFLLHGIHQSRGHLHAETLADSLLQELAAWSGRKAGGANEDDLTLMVIDSA
jgi:hypothetical protein